MRTIDMTSLPTLSFAHIFSADTYENEFAPKENFIEITYISEGSITLEWDSQKVFLHKGDVLCQMYDKHLMVTADAYHEHHTVGVRVQWKSETSIANGLYLPLITPAEIGTGKIQNIINQLIDEQFSYRNCRAKCTAKVFSLLCEIDACNRKAKRISLPSEHMYAQMAKEYIHENIHTPISQAEVAAHLGISPEYLCTVFKKAEGITLIRYCNQIKLQKIEELMKRENMRLHKAAALYGYSDPNYVSTLFKRYNGHSITKKHTV